MSKTAINPDPQFLPAPVKESKRDPARKAARAVRAFLEANAVPVNDDGENALCGIIRQANEEAKPPSLPAAEPNPPPNTVTLAYVATHCLAALLGNAKRRSNEFCKPEECIEDAAARWACNYAEALLLEVHHRSP